MMNGAWRTLGARLQSLVLGLVVLVGCDSSPLLPPLTSSVPLEGQTVARTAWWAIGLSRQAEAFLDGTSTDIVHAASGRRVSELEYDLLMLLDD